ncbi:riboflavin synthase [Pleionea sp. CnH1-48]|uniref:riboflavin synthase n=1 Tax=Pleionea sp. CnH1-48 TaxID=2954494 RepID=UPI002097D015|nr:riboflavin synthase [Pleionea sp. CnH1-48]MCO7225733.1 riboflavin synthase [Pleionea sp. CnH1-48]
MFTGIIEAVGQIQAIEERGGDRRYTIGTGKLDMSDVALGDSIACNGVCLTVIEFGQDYFKADVSGETLELTGFDRYANQAPLNLEKALTPTKRLGGHLVSGHVDGIGKVMHRWQDARSVRFVIKAPDELARYIAHKGSICIDGISLTVNKVMDTEFELNIVPHTLQETIMENYAEGTLVNLEVDQIARYLERLLQFSGEQSADGITLDKLAQYGFMK